MKSRYVHDCHRCVFLGPYKDADLYVCNGTVVARYSSEGSDYASGLLGAYAPTDDLAMALRRATEIGIDPMNFNETKERWFQR